MPVSHQGKIGGSNLHNCCQFNCFSKTPLRFWSICLIGPQFTAVYRLNRDHALLSHTNLCGLHCGVWVIDCASWQAYNVCVIMASCERCPQGGAEERLACPKGEGEAPAMGSIKRGRVIPTATGYKRALAASWKIAARRLPPEGI